jgi:DNA-directed RNA polymerase
VTTASGLPVSNRYHKLIEKRVAVSGGHKHKICVGAEKQIDLEKAARSAPANFIHSCDASHMAYVVNRAVAEDISDLGMIHDSFSCPAAQAGEFRKIILEEFVSMYSAHNVLADVRAAAAHILGTDSGLPEVPRPGEFDLQDVLRTQFAFDC